MKTFLFSMYRPLGDFILTWPTLQRLRAAFPDHAFVGLGKPDQLELARALGLVDAFHDIRDPGLKPLYTGAAVPDFLGDVDAAVIWSDYPFSQNWNMLRRQCGPRFCFHPSIGKSRVTHIIEHHFTVLPGFGLSATPGEEPHFPLASEASGAALIHPGAGRRWKIYRPELYLSLARELREAGHRDVRFVLGPRETAFAETLGSEWPVVVPSSCLELARLLAGASLFIGNDSGPSHLAGFLGTRTLALYRRDNVLQWGVRGRHAWSLEAKDEPRALAVIRNVLDVKAMRFKTECRC